MQDESPPFVTVVSGLPRSGTSMMMQMLAAGGVTIMTDHQRVADEDNAEGYYELEAVKRTRHDDGWLRDAPGKAVKVIYRLLEDLPTTYQYRILFMLRPLGQVVASQLRMLERRGTQGADVSADQLEKIFAREIERVQSWLATQDNCDWISVQYTEVLADAPRESERICQFLALPLDAAAMAARVNRQLHHQRSQ